MNRWKTASVICTVILFLAVGQASAHKVSVYAYEEGGNVHTESYFVDGTPARNSRVTAYDDKGKIVAEGRTDNDGIFIFPVEQPGDLRIVLEASMGHRNEVLLPAVSTVGAGGSEAGQVPDQGKNAPIPGDGGLPGPANGLQGQSLEKAVGRVLDARLASIHESILEIQRAMEKPSLSQVFGGLGYIIGLAGAFLWGLSRKRQ